MNTIQMLKMTGIATAALLASGAMAQAPNPSQTELEAQLTITQKSIEQMMRQLESRTVDPNFKVSDYREWNLTFQRQVSQVLDEFERTLHQQILPKARPWLDKYNAVYASTAFTPAQKGVILKDIANQATAALAPMSDEYKAAIAKVYGAIGALPASDNYSQATDTAELVHKDDRLYFKTHADYGWRFRLFEGQAERWNGHLVAIENDCKAAWDAMSSKERGRIAGHFMKRSYNLQFLDGSVERHEQCVDTRDLVPPTDWNVLRLWVAHFLGQRIMEERIYDELAKGCRSQLCISMKAADLALFPDLVEKTINVPRNISFADGETAILLHSFSAIGGDSLKTRLMSAKYPAEYGSLPFDAP